MDMKTYQVPPVNKPQRKPILYWEAWCNSPVKFCIEANNSIAILRHKYGNSMVYKAVR